MVIDKIKPIDSMWVEKYRPKKLDEMVFADKEHIINLIKKHSSMPHLLFHSLHPGTGKSCLAQIIIKELDADALLLNSGLDRSMEIVRKKVRSFSQTKSSNPDVRRIVFLDEIDGMRRDAQKSMLNVMETYASNTIFIATCNNINKLEPALIDRFVTINFSKPDKKEMFEFLKKICDKEQLEYTDAGLNQLILMNYPSIRACVKTLQMIKSKDGIVNEEQKDKLSSVYDDLYDKITIDKDWKVVQERIFTDANIDVPMLNKHIWFRAVLESKIRLMQITAVNDVKFKDADQIVVFVTSLLDMVK